MGLLIDGTWHNTWYEPDEDGKFVRPQTRFRNRVSADGSSGFKAEAGRYHLYVSLACPWAHRTLIMRKLKRLESAITVSVVNPDMLENGWSFDPADGVIADSLHNARYMHEVYTRADAHYTGRVTVPVLWDKRSDIIVSNESREILRMLDTEFDDIAVNPASFYPDTLAKLIDETIDAIYEPVNNGVYRAGFAVSQEAYEQAVTELFQALDYWDAILGRQRFLCGNVVTEADWCLFTTLFRFDAVYFGHFKCNLRRITDYSNLWPYVRDLYQHEGIADTCNMDHCKRHYYYSHDMINPTRIVPAGPELDFMLPHGRDQKFGCG
ncbi:MAG: glutathione S-transferase family protein [Gammaproteobacteria bacterium]|nr:glutathione S-transferase family protein [Gammaproteobacteria bacterium]